MNKYFYLIPAAFLFGCANTSSTNNVYFKDNKNDTVFQSLNETNTISFGKINDNPNVIPNDIEILYKRLIKINNSLERKDGSSNIETDVILDDIGTIYDQLVKINNSLDNNETGDKKYKMFVDVMTMYNKLVEKDNEIKAKLDEDKIIKLPKPETSLIINADNATGNTFSVILNSSDGKITDKKDDQGYLKNE